MKSGQNIKCSKGKVVNIKNGQMNSGQKVKLAKYQFRNAEMYWFIYFNKKYWKRINFTAIVHYVRLFMMKLII